MNSTQCQLWQIITCGEIKISSLEEDRDEEKFNQMQLNNKVRYTHVCALSKNESKKVCRWKTTKEIQESFVIYYMGNDNMRLKKVTVITCQYKSFTIKDCESVDDMFRRIQILLFMCEM